MKVKLKFLIGLFCLFTLSSSFAADLASCDQDVIQMSNQIAKYGSITTLDGDRFTLIANPIASKNTCKATGYYLGIQICNVSWQKGDWGRTLQCL